MTGILGSLLGESPEEQKHRLTEASKDANDLTKLVKRKRVAQAETTNVSSDELLRANGKRRMDLADAVEDRGITKRTKVEDED